MKRFETPQSRQTRSQKTCRLLVLPLGLLLVTWQARADVLKALPGHVPEAARRIVPTGNLADAVPLNLALGLPLRDSAGLAAFLQHLSDPNDPLYRKYVTPEEFAERFGPSQAQYEQVINFAQRNHLTITRRHVNRLLLDVSGSAADVQRAFNVNLRTYPHPNEPRHFFAPDTEPSVEAQLPLVDVSGLNNYVRPHPRSVPMAHAGSGISQPNLGSGPDSTYRGGDFRAAYLPGVTLTGTGQIVGLLQFDGFYAADISNYEIAAGLPHVPLQTVLVDGFDGVPTTGANSGNSEVSLDLEMVASLAPGLSKIIVFEAGPNGIANDILSEMTAYSQIKQFGCSWGWGGGPNSTTDNLFKQMAAQGQSFFCASGDNSAFPPGAAEDPNQANEPATCPYITVVGGTTLTTTGPGGAWSSEQVWNRGSGTGSSGGISSRYLIPLWQSALNLTASGGSNTHRNTPDVAAVAENVYVVYGNGTNGSFGGTSCAAPLWAGMAALMSQQASSLGKASVGFINPAIYALARGSAYAQTFHDITVGDNTWASSPSLFYAAAGYDLCTGLGTPAGQSLIDALVGAPLKVLRSSGFTDIHMTGSSCQLSWPGVLGAVYQPQYSTNLISGPWVNLGTPIAGAGQPLTATDPNAGASAPHRFYRLGISP